MYSNYYNMFDEYYNFNNPFYRNNNEKFKSGEILTLNEAIESIRESVGDEREDELFYDTIIMQAPTEKDKNIIISIRDDERKHNKILRELYYEFTGKQLPHDNSVKKQNNMDYKHNLEKALFGELKAVERYRKIMSTMPQGKSYNLLMSIMTDELMHADKYNFLISALK